MSHPHSDPDADPDLGGHLTWLRRLVTVLTATMIGGIVLIVVLLVIRLNAAPPPLAMPEGLRLPDGGTPAAVTFLPERILAVDAGGMLHVYDRAGGALLQSLSLP